MGLPATRLGYVQTGLGRSRKFGMLGLLRPQKVRVLYLMDHDSLVVGRVGLKEPTTTTPDLNPNPDLDQDADLNVQTSSPN